MKQYITVTFIALFIACSPQKKELDNPFYAFNNSVRTMLNPPEGMDAQAELIKQIGFDGFAGHHSEDYFERRAALDKVGLTMPEIYWGFDLDSAGNCSYKDGLDEIIRDAKGRNLIVTLYINAESWVNNKDNGDKFLASGIQELADFALEYDAGIAIYPHVNNYVERMNHAIKLVKLIDRKNVGAVFNLCHLLKVEGEPGWQEKLINAVPYLFLISINGSDSGNTTEMEWDQLIQPLGEGDFDSYAVVKLAVDNGYKGPFGLQCYNIQQDCEMALKKSIETWKTYQEKYKNQ
jgi:sugar phosphate isomerase/epimerase